MGKVFTPPFVPAECREPHRFIEAPNSDHFLRLRFRNMLERGLFELNQYTLPVLGNGRLWKPAFEDAMITDGKKCLTAYGLRKQQSSNVNFEVGTKSYTLLFYFEFLL